MKIFKRLNNNRRLLIRGFIVVIVLRAIIIIGFGLLRTPESRLRTIVASEPECFVPCWQGVHPNQTTTEEFQSIRGRFPSLTYGFVRRDRDYLDNLILGWFDFHTGMPMSTYIEDDKLTHLLFIPGLKAQGNSQNSTLSLGQVFSELGVPDSYEAFTDAPGFFVGHSFFYEEKGLVITGIVSKRPPGTDPYATCTIPVTADLPINGIYLVEPNPSKEMLIDAVGELFATRHIIQDWDGLGEVKIDPCN